MRNVSSSGGSEGFLGTGAARAPDLSSLGYPVRVVRGASRATEVWHYGSSELRGWGPWPGLRTYGTDGVVVPTNLLDRVRGTGILAFSHPSILFDYQRDGATWLAERDSGLLAWDPGTGKTRTLLCASYFAGRILVVAPLYLARTWRDEMERIGDLRRFAQLTGRLKAGKVDDASLRRHGWDPEARVVFIHPEILESWDTFLLAQHFDTIIFDEAHRYKHKASGMSRGARLTVAGAARVWMASGTALDDRLLDLWHLLHVMQPGCWGRPFDFRTRYCDARRGDFGLKDYGISHAEELRYRLGSVLHRKRAADTGRMPELHWSAVSCAAPGARAQERAAVAGERIETIVQQLLSGDGMGTEAFRLLAIARQHASTEKISTTKELVRSLVDCGEQVLVFTSFIATAHKLAANLNHPLTGDLSVADRNNLCDLFTSRKLSVLVATYKAAGEGLNLQIGGARHVVLHDLDFSVKTLVQAVARLWRVGARGVTAHVVVAENTLDELFAEILTKKLRMVSHILQEPEAIPPHGLGNVMRADEVERSVRRLWGEQ